MALLQIPVSALRGTYFDYKGIQVTLSKFKHNPYIDKKMQSIDISWLIDGIEYSVGGVVLLAGVNIIQQYGEIPLPNLFVLSAENTKEDPVDITDINLYILDNSEV